MNMSEHNERVISERDAYLTASPYDDCNEPVEGHVNSFDEFLEQRGFGEKDIEGVTRNTYKYTSCGAFCAEEEGGVVVGSIVEGVDYGTENHKLTYPFKLSDFWEALGKVEDEAKQIWEETHGCEKCWSDTQADEWGNEREFGAWPINPDCKTCRGSGAII